jgi:endonuclease-3
MFEGEEPVDFGDRTATLGILEPVDVEVDVERGEPMSRSRKVDAHATPAAKRRARAMLKKLRAEHPDAHCALDHASPFQLVVATILSAQCTDERVNKVTPALFRTYRNAKALGNAPDGELEEIIRSTGFFRAKARNLRGLGRTLTERFEGRVPDRMVDLLTLPGVARKTANVVLGVAFEKAEGVVVDTHVRRLATRMGFTQNNAPEKIEQDLMALFPRKDWIDLSHVLIFHGRRICQARKPRCEICPVKGSCLFASGK